MGEVHAPKMITRASVERRKIWQKALGTRNGNTMLGRKQNVKEKPTARKEGAESH